MATASKASDTARRTWNKEEFAAKAKEKDQEERERMKENEERMKKGKKPRRFREELPKPTELLKQREGPLELDKNQNKTMIINNPGGRGPGQPGYYCEVCNRTSKDSAAYLNHINGRAHLRKLGQTTTIARSNVEQVRARIAFLREKTKEAANAKAFDFDQRLKEIRQKEEAERLEAKEKKKAEKEAKRMEMVRTIDDGSGDVDMSSMMGFAGFGTSKK
ncbi:hypothetical protein FRB93_000474 [Tulasnella sp. JGI-2019a]|nr:hypothetical protein FRB93_000474 [Tulasnella sp. JGI-2019a]